MRKKYFRYFAVAVAFTLVAALTAGCASAENKAEKSTQENSAQAGTQESTQEDAKEDTTGEIVVTDMTGAKVRLDAVPEKVVAIAPSDCEILYAVGAGDTLTGRGEYCDYPEEALKAEAVNSGSEINLEQILALEPDLVLMNAMDHSKEQIQSLRDAGLAVAVSNAADIEGVYESIAMVGELTDHEAEADKLIGNMKASFNKIQSKVPKDVEKKTVYFEVSPLEYGLWTAGSGTFMNELAELLGVENAFADIEGWAEISEEQVIERNPDYIVTITMFFGEGTSPEEEILGRDGWSSIKAVKNKEVLNVDSNEISRPGPRLEEAARSLFDFFYGN